MAKVTAAQLRRQAEKLLGAAEKLEGASSTRSASGNGKVSLDMLRELFGKEVGKSKRGNPIFEATAGMLPGDLRVTLVRGKTGLYAIIPNGTQVAVRKGELVELK